MKLLPNSKCLILHLTHCKLRLYDFKFAKFIIFSNSFFDNRITDNLGCLISPMLCKVGSVLICPNEIGFSKVFIGSKSIASQFVSLVVGS
ncbi:MAG: hypothetical protein A2545_06665 [Planctomycetes bacterium RIFOXYD2_FULL_41_16]|nr:MAG: hypothetical protein A2545_06665 [Planctomycetes bacterium RIFOXYD2_FULL_41_16]